MSSDNVECVSVESVKPYFSNAGIFIENFPGNRWDSHEVREGIPTGLFEEKGAASKGKSRRFPSQSLKALFINLTVFSPEIPHDFFAF